MKEEKVSKINDSAYYESDEHAGTMSDSSKQVDASNKPITDTHIVNIVHNLSVRIVSVKPAGLSEVMEKYAMRRSNKHPLI